MATKGMAREEDENAKVVRFCDSLLQNNMPPAEDSELGLASLLIKQLQFIMRLSGSGDIMQSWEAIAGSDADSANVNALSHIADAVPAKDQVGKDSILADPLQLPVELTGPSSNHVDIEKIFFYRDERKKNIELGKGSFGTVLLGSSQRNPVAIKIVKGGEEEQKKLMEEIKILSQISRTCPLIVQYLGYSTYKGRLLLLMAYHPGGTLFKRLRCSDRYQYRKRGKKALVHISTALLNLHEKGIAHLDLKSANILIAQDGSMQVADVGQARLVREGEAPRTQTGTFGWASPEQRRRQPVTMKSDIFSLGVIIYEICTLQDPRDLHRRAVNVPEDCPQEVLDLIDDCCRENPKERPTAYHVWSTLLALQRSV